MTFEFHDAVSLAVKGHPYPLVFATISGAHLYGFTSSSPPRADCSYLRARSSACYQNLVFVATRNRPVRPGSVPSSHLGQRQRR